MNNLLFKIRSVVCGILCLMIVGPSVLAADKVLTIGTPMPPPGWALLERELLRANAVACREFFEKYFDERGYLLCVERWGGDDGPDDAIENCNYWPELHALGATDDILKMYKKAWEGHLRQFTEAKTVEVPFARDGMYYKEFPVMFDWLHNGEGLNVFNRQGLSDPNDRLFQQRVRRYAGFYMNEDPGAPNYDPEHKIIRSMFNGSRGPLLRKATGLDWAGDPIEVENRFLPRHGESNYEEMIFHFKDYNDIVGDHPQNLAATTLAFNAYMLDHEDKYKQWLLEYVDAWLDRTIENGGIIPTNIGLNGKIGGETDGKWYGGVYGWAFTIEVPQTGEFTNRNTHAIGLNGFGNAYLLTGDPRYIDVWRNMIDTINSNKKTIDGVVQYPTMYGDEGWYAFRPQPYASGLEQICYWSMKPEDRLRMGDGGWWSFLEGKAPDFAEQSLRAELETIRQKVQAMHNDPTTPDTRLADDPMPYNPATVRMLIRLMLGGLPPTLQSGPMHSRLRYFDPVARRAGVPEDVAALVTGLTANETTVVLVNVNQTESRELVVQMGAYGEHQCSQAKLGDQQREIENSVFHVRLAPGCGAELVLKTERYANQPTLSFPWDRSP
ncbi:MAG: hypothetical protein ABGX16_22050 [Pirellulales bacterium]